MRKLLSFVVACSMVFGSVPAPALAEAVEEAEAIVQGEVTEEQPESQPGDEALGQTPGETAPESEGGAVAVEEDDSQEDALTVQNATKPYQVVLEAWVDYGSGGRWSSNSLVSPMDQFRIRAVDSRDDAMNMNYYDWHNATDTITFVPYPDETATYREGHTGPFTVSLNADKSSMDGLFYEEDGLTLPLPPGEYTFIVTSEAGEYSSLENGGSTTITVDDSSSYIFNGFYQTDGAGSFTRESFSVKGSESGQELDLVDLDTRVDLRLAINTVSVLGENPVVGSLGLANPILSMYKAKDGNTALTIEQLEQLSASGNMDAWPSALTWNGDAVDQKPVWQRSTSTTGTNGTTWSLTPSVGQKTAVFAINGIKLGERFGTETTSLQPGVYFPVLRLNIDGELYYFAYNPIEVGYLNNERVAPTITTQTLPSAMKGLSYATTLKARTGIPTDSDPGTFSWAVTTGELPAGLSLNASTGAVSGTLASDATTQTFTVTLTETVDGVPMTTSKQYTIEVRDAVTLGEITYTPTGIIYIEDQDGATMHLSVPVSADLTNTALNLSQSDVVFNVYQTARNSTTSSPVAPQGSPLLVEACYNKQAGTLETDVPIGYDTIIVNRIEVNLRLKDNNGEYVQMPKEGDVSGEGDWAIITAEVAEPNITIGSYVRFPALSFDDEEATDIPTSARLCLWPYAEGSTAIPDSATEYELGTAEYTGYAQAKLVPGDYVFVIDGEAPIYDANGQPSGKTRIVDLVGSVTDATPIEGTNPRQYLLHVGPNDGTFSNPRVVGVSYTTKNMSAKIRHYLNVRFQNESGEYTDDFVADYEARWYRRKGDTQDTDVLVATGHSVQFGPSPYDLYVEVVPTGRNTSFWKSSDRVLVEDDVAEPVVNVPRKQLFSGTFTLSCVSGKMPVDNGSWGIIEVQTPLAAGGYSSYNLWPTKNDTNTVVISGLTSGSIITFTPRIELEAGPVSYEVPATTTGNFTVELVAPLPHSLITFEGLSFTDVDGKTTTIDLNDGLTGVSVKRVEGGVGKYPVPYYVADGTHIVLQPEQHYTEDYYLLHNTPTQYAVTITRRVADAPERMGTTHADVAMSETRIVELSKGQTSATVAMGNPVTSFGYVNVPFSNPAKKLCTLLLYDGEGRLVESGSAGTSERLRTPFLPAGNYTLYAVDTNYLPKNAADYKTKTALEQKTASANAACATSTTLTVAQGKAATASVFTFPSNAGGGLVDREQSSVTVETAYTDKLGINMHAVLAKGVELGVGAHLEIATNQPTDAGAHVYMNPRALNINDKPVKLSKWNETYAGSPFGYTSNMNDGVLDINLDTLASIDQAYVAFPMDMTLVIPQTVYGYVEASVWVVAGDGTRALVGAYRSDSTEVTLEAPEVVAWDSFTVHGDAGPHALVTLYVDGMRAATTKADGYGYYEAEIALPDGVRDYDEFTVAASAQWTRGEAAYAAVSDVVTCMYSTTFPAVESIILCYQPKAEATYSATRLYFRGSQPSKYLTIQRDGHVQDFEKDAKESKFFYLVTFANGSDIKSVSLGIPSETGTVEPETTDVLATAESWIEDVKKADVEQEDSFAYARYAAYGWPMSSAGSTVKTALLQNVSDGAATRAFVSKPVSFAGYSDEVDVSFELEDFDEDAAHVNILPASDMGTYDGWTSHRAGDVALTAEQLATYVGAMGSYREDWGRLVALTADEWAAVDDDTTFDELLASDRLNERALTMLRAGGNLDEWLLVGGSNLDETEETALPVHHTVSTQSMGVGALKGEVDGVLAGAKRVTDAYEAWEKTHVAPTDESVGTYDDARVVCAGGVETTDEWGMPYFIETTDADGNARAEWMETYEIENSGGKYLHCQTFMSKNVMRFTYWNERYGQKVTITYALPDIALAEGTLRCADVLEQWYSIQMAIDGGVGAGGDALGTIDGSLDSGLGTQSDDVSSLADLLLLAQDTKGKPQSQSKVKQTVTTVGQWKLWWDGNDKPNQQAQDAVKKARGTDAADAANPNSKWWESGAAQGGTVGDVNGKQGKVEAAKTLGVECGKEVIKQETGHFVPGAGKAFWIMDHWDWIGKQMRKITGQEERDYQQWKWYNKTYGNPRSNKIAKKGYTRIISKYDQATLDAWNARRQKELADKTKKKAKNPNRKADPSGLVYEAVLSNPVEGAKVTLYTYNSAAAQAEMDPAQFVDSMLFGLEDNPQVTGVDGRYQWFVPEGYWQVRVEKDGYEPVSTGDSGDYGLDATKDLNGDGVDDATDYWMPVLPIQLDVNIGLVSAETPKIGSIEADQAGAVVTFSKYVKADSVTTDLFTVNGVAPASIEAVDAEAAGGGSGEVLARTFRLVYAGGALAEGASVEVTFNDDAVTSYAGVKMAAADKTVTETKEVVFNESLATKVAKPQATNRTYNSKEQVGVAAGAGYVLTGTTRATKAGKYVATAKPAAGYAWDDGTRGEVKLAWSVARDKVVAPAAATGLTYTGKEQVGVAAGAGYVVSGTPKAVNAGSYVAYATPDANHCWEDGTVARKTLSWAIAKAANPMKVKAVKRTVKQAKVRKKKQSVAAPLKFTKKAQGKVTYARVAKGSAKCLSVNKKTGKVTVKKGTKKGTYKIKIKVTAAGNGNYAKATKTLTCKVIVK